VCLICSALVSTTAVLLRPLASANREREREQSILDIVARQPGLEDLFAELGDSFVEARVVELETGAYADWIDPASFDQRRAALDPLQSDPLPPERDLARIGRRGRYATVYLVRSGERIELMILPVHGQGYASTLYAYLALAPDGNTVRGLFFYEHGETPGLGADIEDPDWLMEWVGKRVRDEQGIRIGVAADEVDPESPDYPYTVDGITGATMTCNGVTQLLRFWLGDDGFAPFIARIQR
jgi:Na+-transporting NADH:ubiquinone oxidoreductase subunit C